MNYRDRRVNISVVKATVIYKNQKCALDNFSLFVQPGEYVAVLGRNGSGKSTLLKVVAGQCQLTSGSVWIAGNNVTSQQFFQRAHHIAYVHQRPGAGLCSWMTVEENCVAALIKNKKAGFGRWSTQRRKDQISNAIDALNLDRLRDRIGSYVNELSGGEQQMVSLLVAFLQNASILLLDEPTAALDQDQRRDVIAVTKAFIKASRVTTIMVTHSIHEALALSQHILVLERGQIRRSYKGFFRWLATEQDIYNELFA